MKTISLMFAAGVSLLANAQNDSCNKIKFNGVQVELNGPLTYGNPLVSKSTLQSLNTGDPFLTIPFEMYNESYGHGQTQSFNGSVALRAYFSLPVKKLPYLDAYAGLMFGGVEIGRLGYYFQRTDTVDIYSNTLGQNIYKNRELNDNYFFGIQASRTNILVGVNTGTRKSRRIWLTAGFELAPGLLYNYRYYSSRYVSVYERLTPEGQNTNQPFPHVIQNDYTRGMDTKLKGMGFYTYAGLPLSINIRLSKKVKILKNLHLNASASPGLIVQSEKFNGATAQFGIFTGLGLRYIR